MRTRPRATIEDLRLAIDCLPRRTRIAMLDGINGNQIIVGAYANGEGICPMLAAHRAGGRTSVIAFAKAWDRFAFRDSRSGRARRATERELLILSTHLEASLLADETPTDDLAAARSEHLELVARRERESVSETEGQRAPAQVHPGGRDEHRPRPSDHDRSRELRDRPGWAWSRIVRRHDEYERLLRRLHEERTAAEPSRQRAESSRERAEPSRERAEPFRERAEPFRLEDERIETEPARQERSLRR